MTTTYVGAKNEIYSLFTQRFNADAAAIIGYVPQIFYRNNEQPTKPGSDKYWVRASIQTIDAAQTALSDCGEIGKKRYTEYGLFFAQLFAPKSDPQVDDKLAKLAAMAREIFRGTTTEGHVWFRNARINEIDPEALFYRSNVVTEFEYDEIY
jgi:hypothetical protein